MSYKFSALLFAGALMLAGCRMGTTTPTTMATTQPMNTAPVQTTVPQTIETTTPNTAPTPTADNGNGPLSTESFPQPSDTTTATDASKLN